MYTFSLHSHLKRLLLPVGYATLLVGVLLAGTVLAQDAPAEPDPAVAPENDSMLSLVLQGGPVMIPLALASIIALGITFERALSLQRRRVIPDGFLAGLKTVFNGDPEQVDQAVDFCERSHAPVGHIFKSGLQHMNRGLEAVEKAIEDAGEREVDKLKRSLRGLSIIASVSPLLGLLGTVYGMIAAFKMATEAGMGKADVLAGGIYEALVTTATGLTIAVPVLLIFQYFNMRVDALVDEIDELGIDFMQHVFARQDRP